MKKKSGKEEETKLNKIRKTIKDLLKLERPIYFISAHLGLNDKQTRQIVKRFKLQENLNRPELRSE